MTRLVPLLALCLVLMGQEDCENTPPQPNPGQGSGYCHGNDYTVSESVVAGVKSVWNAILQGELSSDRRATVRVRFGQSYCSGVVLTPHTVLTAGHCGYGEATTHTVLLGGYGSERFESTEKLVHPDYMRWVNSGNTDFEARKGDLMLLYFEEELPRPYMAGSSYSAISANVCHGLVAQGWGRHEGDSLELRETEYIITNWNDPKYLKSVASQVPEGSESGRICFGDSGGPLYADKNGKLALAGITTTTMSSDCLAGGTHVNVGSGEFLSWINENLR